MTDDRFVEVERKNNLVWIWLARPELRNAFNDQMIKELHQAIQSISTQSGARALVLAARGNAFCAGADLNWMKSVIDYDFEHNRAEAAGLADMLWALHDLDIPSIALVQGPAVGGGVGLIAACDFAIATETSWFRLSEVKLGLAPAVISPFLLEKMGDRACRTMFLTGKKISALTALNYGLLNAIATPDQLNDLLQEFLSELLTSAPGAIAACKKLLRDVPRFDAEHIKNHCAQVIAHLRLGSEGQEGMKSFLEKRKPDWAANCDS